MIAKSSSARLSYPYGIPVLVYPPLPFAASICSGLLLAILFQTTNFSLLLQRQEYPHSAAASSRKTTSLCNAHLRLRREGSSCCALWHLVPRRARPDAGHRMRSQFHVSTMQTNASFCEEPCHSPLLERDEVHCLWTRAAVLIWCELTTNNTRDDMFSSRSQCGHTELRCELRVISGQLACALLRGVHAVWEDVTAKLVVSHVKESCLMLQRTSTNYLWFRHGT